MVSQPKQQKQPEQVQAEQLEKAMQPMVDFLEFLKQTEPARVRMIEGKRDFLKQIILLSAWIIAFAVPILGKWDLIKNECVYMFSLILFVGLIIVGVLHFYWTNQLEEKTYRKITSSMQQLLYKWENAKNRQEVLDILPMMNAMFDIWEKWKCIECREKRTTNFLVWGFVAWLALLVLSLL